MAVVPSQSATSGARASTLIEARDVSRRYGKKLALVDVDLAVAAGEIRALLGPNGAGKTTLLRILTGLVDPSTGSARIDGVDTKTRAPELRRRVGLVPSGDRSFYLRISGLENLAFFGRLHGMRRRDAFSRATKVLEDVGLADSARMRVGAYSHGMQKRLSVARALLTDPGVLLLDEATHDLDPEGAHRIRELVRGIAHRGTAVIWTTQRVDEIRGFADTVTVLGQGRVQFAGSVLELLAHATPRRYVVRLSNGALDAGQVRSAGDRALGTLGNLAPAGGMGLDDYLLTLADTAVLGDAVASLTHAGIQVIACRAETSEVETAFLELTASERL
jgi:ABC-2 type transport system ATP-binding protein